MSMNLRFLIQQILVATLLSTSSAACSPTILETSACNVTCGFKVAVQIEPPLDLVRGSEISLDLKMGDALQSFSCEEGSAYSDLNYCLISAKPISSEDNIRVEDAISQLNSIFINPDNLESGSEIQLTLTVSGQQIAQDEFSVLFERKICDLSGRSPGCERADLTMNVSQENAGQKL